MRVSSLAAASIIASSASAAPFSLTGLTSITNLFSSLIDSTVSSLVSDLKHFTNAASHGKICNFHNFPITIPTLPPFKSHQIDCPPSPSKSGNFLDWSTFKANGVNLGGWLVIEWSNDQAWWNSHVPLTVTQGKIHFLWLSVRIY